MRCYYCGASLDFTGACPECGADVRIWKKVSSLSNRLYNDGLAKAKVRDLSGAADALNMSLRYNKMNIDARNLLGLVYYETGDTVNALSEWVISKSLSADDNPAGGYLADVQKSSAQLETVNQTIKKFNQSLDYCREGNYDLAVIQLKKVLSLNPKIVKGHQLLALLYMREERYDLAMRSLRHAAKIDANNTDTMRYIRECREHLRANGKLKPSKSDEETVTYQSGNDIIIRPTKITDNTAVRTVVNLLMGAAIGIAVVCFLVIPEIRQRANTEASAQVVEANQTISAREQTIQSLEDQIETLNQQVEDATSATDSADEKTTAYSRLLDAYVSYSEEKYTEAGETMSEIDRGLLDENAQTVYDEMLEKVETAMLGVTLDEANTLYAQKDYAAAIEKYLEVVEKDQTYSGGEAVYYLAYAYSNQKDYANALKWFEVGENVITNQTWLAGVKSMIADYETLGITAAE